MPVVPFNTKADFDSEYSIGAEPGGRPNTRPEVRLNYHRAVILPISTRRAQKLVDIFAWPTNSILLIVGSGFGWTAEALENDHGYTNIISIDSSAWIQSAKNTDESTEVDAAITAAGLDPTTGEGLTLKGKIHTPGNRRRASRDIEDENLSNNGSRNRVKAILGDIEIGVTESVLSSLSDAEILNISSWIDQTNPGITRVHLVTTAGSGSSQNPAYNWHTLAEYKVLLPSDTFVDVSTWEVL